MKRTYQDQLHVEGRLWMIGALLLFLSAPIILSIGTGVWPTFAHFIPGFIATAIIFWPVTTIEVFTFSPMLGVGSTYLAFVTGNLTSLKVPAALNAQDALGVEKGTDEGDVIATLAVASSSIITTLIIFVGALLIIPLTPLLESPALKPAFDNIIPALFGALGIVYISKRIKIAIVPLVIMMIFFPFVPGSGGLVGIMVPVGVVISILVARILYKKGMIS
ncbi:MAG: hypothetical protein A2Y45_05235 [Tenericutes bacterium GWC2_34_14]|nr:MAG: hypothetical protein A2Z84_06020 [Tenericutes bacterium GWA2_35_7]OHE28358.1 MAG: hypothetical protein A2Y45_05235 [Tenericutes bacterium GWC2_34_14]OHE33734.1 MAG: hypothetical protein A2012_04575 [Tenericutes bacterium GWE2_34_108]OHE37019.1 MAG: hypothetical protein A2Y46_10375 [Tenericutes bacterium GWF1_35_14]OHE37901.1 MAG: hypothetical protein A2Y44_08290 [Tenericutes bacterium GWF2_35_184]OHE41078.1 MAG: hypothetical protein A3K26_01295 [Tenericutes bacterium RIFOXYA12_FULL_35_